jgi:voltage-gated potassium channel
MRQRYTDFIASHDIAWELTMGALAAAYVVIGFAADDPSASLRASLEAAELALTAIFVVEFTSRFAAARSQRAYLRGHWIDLVALVPVAREVRLLRLLRLLRLVRMFAGVYRALTDIERLARHRSLVWLFVAWLGVAVICSSALFLAENGVNPNIHSPLDALWWGVVTLSTVGYGDIYPVTPEGRLAGAALMILGITLFAAITGTITSFLVSQQEARADDVLTTIGRLGALRDSGLLTGEEFEAKKTELLARL